MFFDAIRHPRKTGYLVALIFNLVHGLEPLDGQLSPAHQLIKVHTVHLLRRPMEDRRNISPRFVY
ncbi:hypothetical protein ACZ98_24410 (plasmid) [Vibrio parahaemolyticus]|nr:hypothetical protein ACZ98_24410 [Vibrio parahaemolyticus]